MKLTFVLLLALACLLAVSQAQKGEKKCDRKCPTYQVQAVCATKNKGKTYRRFGSNCLLDVENCRTRNAYRKVNLLKCRNVAGSN